MGEEFVTKIDEIVELLESEEDSLYTYDEDKKIFKIFDKKRNINLIAKLEKNNFYFKDNISGKVYILVKKYLNKNTTIQQILIDDASDRYYCMFAEKNNDIELIRVVEKMQDDVMSCTNTDLLNKNGDEIIEYMKNAVKQDKVSHAYILNGPKGSGKKLLAKLFAQELQCENNGDEPCNKCHSCRQAMSGNHPDIIRVTHEKPNSISVDEIRVQINEDIQVKPYNGKYKIYIVPDADLMTVQAQNALLKTIEEPPSYAVIFLLTENADSLLPTICSRCVMLKLRNIKDKLVKKYLMETLEIPDYKADVCTAFAQGNVGRAIMLANSEHFNEIKEEAIQLLKNIDTMEVSDLVEAVKRITAYKIEINDYLDILMIWYRDVLIYKATKNIDRVIFSEQLDYIKERAKKSSYEGIETILNALEKAKTRLKANVNFDLVMELLLLTIKEN